MVALYRLYRPTYRCGLWRDCLCLMSDLCSSRFDETLQCSHTLPLERYLWIDMRQISSKVCRMAALYNLRWSILRSTAYDPFQWSWFPLSPRMSEYVSNNIAARCRACATILHLRMVCAQLVLRWLIFCQCSYNKNEIKNSRGALPMTIQHW